MLRRALMAISLLALAAAAQAATLTETIDKTFEARAGAAFLLSNTNGRVLVRAWDQPRIKVHAEKMARALDSDAAKAALRDLKVDLVPDDGGLRVIGHFPHDDFSLFGLFTGTNVNLSIDYEIDVPRHMNVKIANVNGSVQLTAVEGTLKISTTNGAIHTERTAGSLEAETTNGSVHVQMLTLAGNDPVRIETTNGRIELSVPRATTARLDAETTNGSVESELPVTTQGKGHHSLQGTINGGGPLFHLRTTNGSIAIHAN